MDLIFYLIRVMRNDLFKSSLRASAHRCEGLMLRFRIHHPTTARYHTDIMLLLFSCLIRFLHSDLCKKREQVLQVLLRHTIYKLATPQHNTNPNKFFTSYVFCVLTYKKVVGGHVPLASISTSYVTEIIFLQYCNVLYE